VVLLFNPRWNRFTRPGRNTGQWMIYFQSDQADQVRQVREAAESAGLLGRRVFADVGPFKLAQSAANKAILGGETQPTVTQDR